MRKFLGSARGSASVESAIYFPIAILCAAAVIALVINMYMDTSAQAYAHIALRAESVMKSGTAEILSVGTAVDERNRIRQEAEAKHFAIAGGGAFELEYVYAEDGSYELGRSYVIDEGLVVKGAALVTGLIE
ncbi:MAG: hypothetical protein LBN36_05660 [Clostridiales Family XIII bacterium]|jgi:hypothetical protein|nr:hypothetical protein [Clostridiales Family XIII bacterium]